MALNTTIAYVIAAAIPLLLIYTIYALDMFETGKKSTVYLALIWGASGAFGLAYLINTQLAPLIGVRSVVVVTAPIAEEILKALILIYFVRQPSFRYVVDGAIYGFAVGVGFAVIENIFYISTSPDIALTLAVSRVFSASLMHAAASAMVGIALGRLRRVQGAASISVQVLSILLAILLHIIYNNVVNSANLTGFTLYALAIMIGLGSSVVIGYLIVQGLADEKRHFVKSLSDHTKIALGERKAVQRLGGSGFDELLGELRESFGDKNTDMIRRLLVKQANIGILQNNLNTIASERLRAAWIDEIAELQAEVHDLRDELGLYVMSYLSNVFPTDDMDLWNTMIEEMAEHDPTLVHTFDMFMHAAQLAQEFDVEQLRQTAEELSQIDIFKYVDLANLESLSRAVRVQTFSSGTRLFDQGDDGDAMYLIRSGQIQIYTRNEERERIIRTFEPGHVVGVFSVLDGLPRSAGAYALGDLTAMVLQRQVFMMFLQSRPRVILAVLHVLTEKARYTTELLQENITWVSNLAQGNYADLASTVPGTIWKTEALRPDRPQAAPALSASEAVAEDSTFLGGIYNRITQLLNVKPGEADTHV